MNTSFDMVLMALMCIIIPIIPGYLLQSQWTSRKLPIM
jgi:hypothetical protein